LTGKDTLSPYTQAELERLKPASVYIVGDTPSVPAHIYEAIKSLDFAPHVIRIGGKDRYETARMIAEETIRITNRALTEVIITKGLDFPDALASSPFAYMKQIPVLLSQTEALSKDTRDFLITNNITSAVVLGDEKSIAPTARATLTQMGIELVSIGGRDRYETARLITEGLLNRYQITPSLIGVAKATDFPDALAGSASVGARGGILVLT
jgi:putative cell wall-binding protein